MNDAFHSASVNLWAACAASLTARFYIVGMVWTWLLPHGGAESDSRRIISIVKSAQSMLLSVLVSLLAALALAELGIYSRAAERTVLLVFLLGGTTAGLLNNAKTFRRHIAQCLPGMVFLFLGVAVAMNLPRRGEWMLGGWDPGVFLNEGVHVAQTNTFYPEPLKSYELLTAEELSSFSRGGTVYIECFTGVPIDFETRSVRHYFFRMTPTLVAATARAGGLRAATRVNLILGMLVCFMLFAFVCSYRRNMAHGLFSLIMLCAQPVWLYHLNLPISEMLQLFLLLGIGLLIPTRDRGALAPFLLGLTLFCASANRLSFLAFSALIVAALAWADFARHDRERVLSERLCQLLLILAALLFDFVASDVTMFISHKHVPRLGMFAAIFLALAISLDILAWIRPVRLFVLRFPGWTAPAVCALAMGVYAFGWLKADISVILRSVLQRLNELTPFFGPATVLLSIPGGILFFFVDSKLGEKNRDGAPTTAPCDCFHDVRAIRGFVLVMIVATAISMVESFIGGFYPWALRRYLEYTTPLLAILAGCALGELWTTRQRWARPARVIAIVLLATVLANNARRIRHAWSRVEYAGISDVLKRVAEQIEDTDIVVTDHTWWGTPLTFIYGKQVLNGEYFYAKKDARVMEQGLRALARIGATGRRVRFLTSTEAGLSVFPLKMENVSHDWTSGEIIFREIIHSRAARDFVLRDRRQVFRLHTLLTQSPSQD